MSFTFRRAFGDPVLSRAGADRQGRAVKAALTALGSANARAFLNTHHQGLRGRPLDLAWRATGPHCVAAPAWRWRGLETC